MEEILELKECLLNHQYERAMTIVEELELMGRQDKINNLESFLIVLLIHLIKIQVEKRVTRSWRSSILNSLREIQKRNKLGKKSQYIILNQINGANILMLFIQMLFSKLPMKLLGELKLMNSNL